MGKNYASRPFCLVFFTKSSVLSYTKDLLCIRNKFMHFTHQLIKNSSEKKLLLKNTLKPWFFPSQLSNSFHLFHFNPYSKKFWNQVSSTFHFSPKAYLRHDKNWTSLVTHHNWHHSSVFFTRIVSPFKSPVSEEILRERFYFWTRKGFLRDTEILCMCMISE